MRCPVCKGYDKQVHFGLHAEGFDENIIECRICGSIWAINHGVLELVRDSQEKSFLETLTERVESDDYHLVA